MKIGFYTYQYIDVAGMPIPEVLEIVAADGYDGIDISATRGDTLDPSLFPQDDRRLYREAADRLGLEINAVVTHLPMINSVWDGQPINIPGAIDLAIDVGASIVTIHIGSNDESEHPFDLAWESAVEHLQDACKFAASQGILIALDAIWPKTLLDTAERVIQFIEDVDSPVLCHNYDPCLLALADIEPGPVVRKLAGFIRHVHVKDYRGTFHNHHFHVPGDGKLNYKTWINALKRAKYKGYLTIECFKHHDLKRASRIGKRTIEKFV